MLCLKLSFHRKETIERITYVKNNSNDSIVRFEAEMMLEANEMYD